MLKDVKKSSNTVQDALKFFKMRLNDPKFIYLFKCRKSRLGCLPSFGRPQTQQHMLPHRSYLQSVPAMSLSPGHDLAEELHQVVIRVQVQALAQIRISLTQAEVFLVLPQLEDAGLALPAVASYLRLCE